MSAPAARSEARRSGARSEDQALAHLEQAGLRLVERNFNCRLGELDLVMLEGATLVFVEVRYRRSGRAGQAFGDGIDSISVAKRARLLRAASMFLARHPQHAARSCRFDVVAASGAADALGIRWLRNAFDAD